MKKSILTLGLAAMFMACNSSSSTNEIKTAYVDSNLLLKEYVEVKNMEVEFKSKSEQKGKALESEIAAFQKEVESFQKNAAAKGQAWAQSKAQELQQKEQELQYKQQTLMQALQQESGAAMDAVIEKVKSHISDYAKKNNLDYVFNTEDASTIIFAKEQYNITDIIVKELNDKFQAQGSKQEDVTSKEDTTSKEQKTDN
ncbi:OmpH/Skp family outer membrane protein [Myroides sp. LJL119]